MAGTGPASVSLPEQLVHLFVGCDGGELQPVGNIQVDRHRCAQGLQIQQGLRVVFRFVHVAVAVPIAEAILARPGQASHAPHRPD